MHRLRGARAILAIIMFACAMFFALATSSFAAEVNSECLACHSSMQTWSVGDVDRNTACQKCHLDSLVGTHPRHYAGANCGAVCHGFENGFGASLYSAVPNWRGPQGSFATAASADATPGALHVIHSTPRWPGTLAPDAIILQSESECSQCHAAASCEACHENPPSAADHATHASNGMSSTGQDYTAFVQTPWVGNVANGDGTGMAAPNTSLCGSSGCHSFQGLQDDDEYYKEDYPVAADASLDYDYDTVINKTGTWYVKRGTLYSTGKASITNGAGATLSTDFIGQKVELIGDLDPYRGQAQVWIDGSLAGTFDQYAPITTYQQLVFSSGVLAPGNHTIQVRLLNTKQAASRATYVVVDQFRVYPTMAETVAPQCTNCHADKTTAHGTTFSHEASNTAGLYSGFGCASCHKTLMIDEHRRTGASTNDGGSVCDECHTVYAPYAVDTYDGTCGWSSYGPGCHVAASPREPHTAKDASHTVTPVPATQDCVDCHGADLGVIHDDTNAARPQHASLVGAGSNGLSYTTSCLTCHSSTAFPTTKDCTNAACHAASGVVSMATHPAPLHPANPGSGEALRTGGYACVTCHDIELTDEHFKTTSKTSGSAAVTCGSCHGAPYFPAGWLTPPNNTCVACHPSDASKGGAPHEAADYATKHDFSVDGANSATCGSGAGLYCHSSMGTVDTLHSGAAANCTSCHTSNAAVPTIRTCTTTCHSVTPHNMTLHLAPASAECVDCHESNDVRSMHPTCETCHANGSWPGITTGKTTECVGCHNPTGVGAKDYTPNSSHYSGTETGHTASGNAASTYGGFACTQCHSLEMEQAHVGPTPITFNTTGYDDRCETCHEVRVDSLGTWDTTCADCHAVTHGDTATKHNAATTQLSALLETQTVLSEDFESNSYATNGWTRSNTTRVRIVTTTPHAGTYAGEFYNTNTTRQTDYFEKTIDLSGYTTPRIEFWYSAVAVETGDIARVSYSTDGGGAWTDILPASATPVGWTQISGALPAQANVLVRFWGSVNTNNTEWIRYDDILINGKAPGAAPGTADANCGGGSCHNVADVAFIHNDSVPANGMNPDCATCHANASTNPTKDCFASGCHTGGHGLGSHTANSSQLCVDCHESNNVQTIHPTCDTCHANPSYPGITAANTAECTDCHNGLEVGGHNYAPTDPQHYTGSETTHTASAQAGTESGFACSSCHSMQMKPEHITKTTSAFSTVPGTHTDKCVACHEIEVDSFAGAWNDTCDACHTVKHSAMTTAHNGSVVGAACGTTGCHNVTDVRALHSNSVTSNATVTTCVNTCHTSATAVPTTVDCDSAGCHDGTVHPSEASAHTTIASSGCAVCHESADLKTVHANNCATCHGNATYPALPAGKLECTSCHNGTDVGSHVYTPYDPNHYTALPHTADGVEAGISNTGGKTCATCHSLEMKPEHNKTSTSFALGIYADKCAACHELKVDTLGAAWSKDCQACHTTVSVHDAYSAKHDYSLTAANVTACGGANCHNVAMADVIHSSALPGAGDCTSCHTSPNSVPTQTLCTGCHSAHPNQTTVHTSTETECLNCHTGYTNVTTHVGGCAGCHGNATLVDYLKNNYTPTCTGCHNGTVLGSIYTPADPNHYSLALHTPATWTTAFQGAGGDGVTPTEGEECATCHTSTLKIAHATTTTSGGSVTCVECHSNTTLGSATVVAGNWSGEKCKDCHDSGAATTHDTYVTAHTVSTTRGCAGSGASCHGTTTNLAALHSTSQVGGVPKYNSCSNTDTGETCHVTLDDRPAKVWTGTDSCGEGSTGCHTEKNTTNHGGGHVLDAAGSTYNNTTVTGCTAAGTGCHGASTGTNYQGYHPASGCTSGPCHTATNHNDAQFNDPNNCQNCHGGGATPYDNAPDVVGLADATGGHYNETTHTASALTNTVNGAAGGTVTAACTSCHASVGAGIDGLHNQHQSLPAPYGDTTCADCHNYSAGVTAEVKTTNWTSNLCSDCHNGTDMPGLAQHGTTAPAVAATPSGCSAGTTGCHADLNLHEIHKGKSGGLVSSCAISGCHNYSAQGLKPTAKTCGTTGACHTGAVHAGEAAAHTTIASSSCVRCHESADLKTVHANNCATCHGNATYPTLPVGKLECTSCHDGTVVGTHVYTPYDPNHYTGNELTHTADGVEAGITNTGGKACSSCHLLETKLEHFKATTSFNLGGHADRCVACHELKVDTLGGAWSKDCQACHTTASVHTNYSAAHDFAAYNASNTTSCGGANCHNVALADVVHSSTLPGTGDCGSCHSSSESVTERLCVDCHAATPHASATAHNSTLFAGSAECRSCHTAYSDITVHAGGCAICHSNATLTDYLKNNYTANCVDCHASGVLGGTYTPADPNHYVAATHTANIAADTVATGGSVITTKACTACHSTPLADEHNVTVSVGNVSCVECHTNTTLGSSTVVTNNWPTDKCADCHTSTHNTMGTEHNMTGTSSSCAGASCHTVANIAAIHADTVLTGQPTITSCSVCHISADQGRVNGATAALSTATACSSCHPGLPLHESLHLAPSSTACTSCHETNNVQTLHGALGDGCNVCHGGGGFTDVTPPGTTTACVNCHASESPTDPGHYTGTETTHTASAQAGLVNGFACTQCHSTQMKAEHITKTTSAFSTVPGTYADKCIACHEVKVDTLGVWNDTCDACHATKHTETSTKHDATVAGAGCAGVGGAATVVSLHSENFDGVTAPAWPATWTKGGTDTALLVTSTTASSTPNAASFASDASAAKSAYFQRTLDTSGRTNPTLSFAYNTSLPPATGVERIVPDSTVSNATYSIVGGSGSINASIDDPDPYDTSTYASAASAGQTFVVGLGNPVAANGTINSVTVFARVATGERFRWVYNNGTQVTDATNRTSAAYTTLSSFVVPAPTGGWTPAALQNLQVGINSVANGGWTGTCDVTQMYVEIDYTAAASSATNYLKAEYSTTGVGGPWTQVFTTSTTSGWATSTSAVPQSATLLVRFTMASDAATRILRVDDIAVTYEQAGGPSCHAVNDVSAIHNNSIPTNALNPTCVTCHSSATAVPATLACTTAGCHQGWTHSTLHETTLSQDCTSCHVETNVQPPHSALGDGCNVCHGGGGYTDVAEGKSSECVSCHASESPSNATHYVGTETSHTAGALQANATLSYAGNPTCAACHSMEMKPDHERTTSAKTTYPGDICTNCHLSTVLPSAQTVATSGGWTDRNTASACAACHPAAGITTQHSQASVNGNHGVTGDTQGCASSGPGCHPVSNVSQVGARTTTANIHLACASCHGTGARANLTSPGALAQGCTGNTNCHAIYTSVSHNGLTGNEAIHQATNMEADLGVASYQDQCNDCHDDGDGNVTTAGMKNVHVTRAGWTGNYCGDCHNATTPINSGAVIKGTWNQSCDACHATKHAAFTAATHDSNAGSGCTIGTCHGASGGVADIRAIHDTAAQGCTATGTDSEGWSGACHAFNKQMTATQMSCGSGATGQACHTNHTHLNHGPAHNYSTASNYTDGSGQGVESGCSNSGAGCHGTDATYADAIATYHPAGNVSCMTSACHTSPSMTAGWKSANDDSDCANCHNGSFAGAVDAINLYDLNPAGHYGETTHTVTAGLAVPVTAGGTATASCGTCHDTILAAAHSGAGFNSNRGTSQGTKITCAECHNTYSSVVTSSWTTQACTACHVVGTYAHIDGGADAPVVNATSTAACGASGTGCHTTYNVHELHKNASGGCTLAGCHDAKNKDMTGLAGTCGQATGCHLSTLYTPALHNGVPAGRADGVDADHHTAGATLAGQTYTYNAKSAACSACHSMVLGTEHARTTSALSGAGANNCLKCHNDSATVANIVKTNWANKNAATGCSDCHANTDVTSAATAHANSANHAVGTSVTGCTGLGAGCHGTAATPDLTTVHASGCALTRACHSPTVYNPTAKTCNNAACHTTYNTTTDYTHRVGTENVNGTEATHTVSAANLTGTVNTGGTASAACSVCHSAALKTSHNYAVGFSTASLGWTNECTGCHNATTPINVATLVAANGTWTDSCTGNGCHTIAQKAHVDGGADALAATGSSTANCGASGNGCHATYDLHALHKNAAGGCALAGCHDAANKDKTPTTVTCGQATGCHLSTTYNATSHNALTGDDVTKHRAAGNAAASIGGYTQSTACTNCHSLTLKTAHGSRVGWTTPYCADCHNATSPNNSVNIIKNTAWNNGTCEACHTTKHNTYANHNSTGSSGCAISTCHGASGGTVDVRTLHDKATSGCSATGADQRGWSGACHALNTGMSTSAMSCGQGATGLACHTTTTPGNHGGSAGGQNCLTAACHGTASTERLDKMLPSGLGGDATTYHHVLDAADAGVAPNTGNYPNSTNSLACVSCHVDHNDFNANKGANLRPDIATLNPATGSNTDFSSTAPYGICVSCHSTAQAKDTRQKTTGASANTPIVSGADYDVSKHDYVVASTFGSSTFNANCSKCHDDELDLTKTYQGSTYKFGTHYSADKRIAKALAVTLVGAGTASEENLCYKCHTGATAGNDGYGATAMTARARGIQAEFANTSRHDVANATWTGRHKSDEYDAAPTSIIGETVATAGWWGTTNASLHVECEDCHNPHESAASSYTFPNDNASMRGTTAVPISGANKGVWGVNITGPTNPAASGSWAGSGTQGAGAPKYPTYGKVTDAAYEWQMCLKCHSRYAWGNNAAPNSISGGTDGTAAAMTDVGRDFDPANYAFHPLFATGLNQPSPAVAGNVWNTSAVRRLISGTSTGHGLSNTFVDGWLSTSRVTCSDCHNNETWGTTQGPHGSANKWLLRGVNTGIKVTLQGASNIIYPNTGYSANSYCQNCHRGDVYGPGSGGGGNSTAGDLGRVNHGGDFNSCMDASNVPNQVNGCNNCHGGRPNSAGTGTVKNGFMHGTSSAAGTEGGDPLGRRFCNGASWDSHTLGTGGTVGCSTINTADNYSQCTQHTSFNKKTFTTQYNY